MKVMLSIGHFPESPGAYNKKYDIFEHTICAGIVDVIVPLLSTTHNVIVAPTQTLSEKRTAVIWEKPEILVELHMNYSWRKNINGLLTVYEDKQYDSLLLATMIHSSLLEATGWPDECIRNDNTIQGWRKWKQFYLFDCIDNVNTCLLELGYISNDDVVNSLIYGNMKNCIANAIINGIRRYKL